MFHWIVSMAASFVLPVAIPLDALGAIAPGSTIEFFEAGTTTPRTVYSDHTLTTPIAQPIAANAAGRFPLIYMATGSYKIRVKDPEGAEIADYCRDNLDTGIPANSGALFAALPDFFAAESAAEARLELEAAGQSEVDTLSASVSAIEAQIDEVGGTLGALAGLDKITRAHLDTGFGLVIAKRTLVASTANVISGTGTFPYDNTIPQNTGGNAILSGSFTPASASSTLFIEADFHATISAANMVTAALFRDTAADAIAATYHRFDSTNMRRLRVVHNMSSWGTVAATLALRAGGAGGTLHVNANSAGTRVGGGILVATLRVTEFITF
jgi:hypothetical protein